MPHLPINSSEPRDHSMAALSARLQARLVAQPTPGDWADDEPMELAIAVKLGLTFGLSAKALRRLIDTGQLAFSSVAGRFYVTKQSLKALFEPKLTSPKVVEVDVATPPQVETLSAIEEQLEWEHTAHTRKNSRRRGGFN